MAIRYLWMAIWYPRTPEKARKWSGFRDPPTQPVRSNQRGWRCPQRLASTTSQPLVGSAQGGRSRRRGIVPETRISAGSSSRPSHLWPPSYSQGPGFGQTVMILFCVPLIHLKPPESQRANSKLDVGEKKSEPRWDMDLWLPYNSDLFPTVIFLLIRPPPPHAMTID